MRQPNPFYAGGITGTTYTAVTLRARWALSPRGLRHRIVHATAAWRDGQVVYRGVWLCGDAATYITLLADDAPAGRTCERCALREQYPPRPVVYRCWSTTGELLYIGSTGDFGTRAYQHRCRSPWWPQTKRVTFDEHPTLNGARAAEAEAIATEHRWNVRGVTSTHEPASAA